MVDYLLNVATDINQAENQQSIREKNANILLNAVEHKHDEQLCQQLFDTVISKSEPQLIVEKHSACFGSSNKEAFGHSQSMVFSMIYRVLEKNKATHWTVGIEFGILSVFMTHVLCFSDRR